MKHIVSPEQRAVLSRRQVVSGLLMVSAAGIAAARKPNVELNYLGNHKLDQILPAQIGRWKFVGNSGVVVPPEDQLEQALYSQLLTRVYDDGVNPAIMLLIAYSASQTGFLQVHRPEFCYTAAGFALSDFQVHEVPLDGGGVRVNGMTATRDGMNERLLYWTRIGNHIPLSWGQQKYMFALENLKRIVPDAVLVRVSTVMPDEQQALAAMDEFIRAMVESVPPSLRRVLVV